MERVSSEFLRLLTMAGMEAPADCHVHDDDDDDRRWETGRGETLTRRPARKRDGRGETDGARLV
jgi:hypothetical protein